ncbi:ATP-binding protein [Herbaspirillum sp. GCM10030257]|uniref:ATP-binding protein n=1 Tax=Herbaspirillum sp. GCM10030257 TaxID=3273393 RepID=UPI00361E54EE
MKSIRKALLFWLCIGLSVGIVAAAAILYLRAQEEANKIFDYQMQQLAVSLPSEPFSPVRPGRRGQPDTAQDIVIQIWDSEGLRIYHSHERLALPQDARLGFATVPTREGPWRVYTTQHGSTVVQVAQPMSARRGVAADTALKTVAPLLLLFPFLGALVWLTVSAGLAPIRRLAKDVQSRDVASLAPIADRRLPEEVQPLTHALNDLLARLHVALDAQRAFVADAAHELRSPLTALKLQIQLAERAEDPAERSAAFAELRQGFERATRLVQQLLTLARHEPGASPTVREPVDLLAVARNVVSDLSSIASVKLLDLGLESESNGDAQAFLCSGDGESLRVLLNNLVENAIRYTPQGGRITVTVRATPDEAIAEVQDNGPGIPSDHLERVFDRFYRVPGTQAEGSGLGLAIVRQVAEAHGGRIELENADTGLLARLRLPRLHDMEHSMGEELQNKLNAL